MNWKVHVLLSAGDRFWICCLFAEVEAVDLAAEVQTLDYEVSKFEQLFKKITDATALEYPGCVPS